MKRSAILLALALSGCGGGDGAAPQVQVGDAWAREAKVGQSSTAAYLTIRNSGGADRLVGVSSPAGNAALHSTTMDGGVMRMRPLEELDIPSGGEVALRPAGTHVMITGLDGPLGEGQGLPLELRFERSGTLSVEAAVRSSAPAMEH